MIDIQNLNFNVSRDLLTYRQDKKVKTVIKFQVGANFNTLYYAGVYHNLPIIYYSNLMLDLANVNILDIVHVTSLADAVKIGMQCQRYMLIVEDLEAIAINELDPNPSTKSIYNYIVEGFYPYSLDTMKPGLAHSAVLLLKDNQWVILDSPYYDPFTQEKENLYIGQDPKKWATRWLPRGSDPYYPMNTCARLILPTDSHLDIDKLVENVGDLGFTNPDGVSVLNV